MRKLKEYALGAAAALIWVASLVCGNGIQNAASDKAMLLYALGSVALLGLGFIPCGYMAWMMQMDDRQRDSRKAHKPHARPYQQDERWGA